MNRNDDDQNKDDGSVWTSYSDLFTTVAIIFLVMFVFALIKAGVSTVQTVAQKHAHEEELRGKIPKELKEKNKKRIEKLSESINEMKDYEDIITKKVQEMNSFAKKLQKNKVVLNKLIEDQTRKDVILDNVRKELLAKEDKLQKELANKKRLKQDITQKEEEIRLVQEEKQRIVEKIRKAKEEAERLNLEKKRQIAKMGKDLEYEKIKYQDHMTRKQQEISSLIEQKKIEKEKMINEYEQLVENVKKKSTLDIKRVREEVVEIEESKRALMDQYENKITELVNQKNQNIKDLHSKLAELAEKKKSIETKLNQKDLTMEELVKQQKDLEKTLTTKDIEIAKAREVVQERINEIRELEDKVAAFKREKYNKEVELEKTKKLAMEKRSREIELMNKVKNLNYELQRTALKAEKYEQTTKVFKDKTKEYLDKLKQANNEKVKFSNKIQLLDQEKLLLTKSQQELKQEMDDLQKRLEFQNMKLKKYQHVSGVFKNKSKEYLDELKDLKVTTQDLRERIAEIDQDKRVVQGKLEQANLINEKLKNELASHTKEKFKFNQNAKELENTIEKLLAQNNSLSNQFEKLKSEYNTLQKSKELSGRDLKGQIASIKNRYEQQIKDQKGQHENELMDLKSMYENKIAGLESKLSNVKSRMPASQQTPGPNPELENQLAAANQDRDSLNKQLNECIVDRDLAKTNVKDVKNTVKNVGRKIASMKNKLRSNIANALAQKFKNANISAKVDPVTGNVTLDLGKNFLFSKNSSRLSRGAKKQLKTIVPIYAEVLFSDKKIARQISSFNIEGHASPLWRQKYVSPKKINSRAYSYNMLLSGERAAAISSYIFSRKMGKYAYRVSLKNKTRAIGFGYSQPVKYKWSKKRSIASKNKCWPYDCGLSQRVELSFTLKDDNDSLNKLFDMTSGGK